MPKPRASHGLSRICAWCGVWLHAHGTAGSPPDSRDDVEDGLHTHTICTRCLETFFGDELATEATEPPCEPVTVRRR